MRSYCVSFRPEVELEENLPPLAPLEERETIDLLRNAAGVLLPSHISPWRYESITRHAHVCFPRLEIQFHARGKTKQADLFQKLGVRHPQTHVFENPRKLKHYFDLHEPPWGYPFVLKGDLGGGGETVFPVYKASQIGGYLQRLPQDSPLLIQKWVQHGGKDLRVVIYGDHAISYFRVGAGQFYNNVCRGAKLDHSGWPDLQQKGVAAVLAFSKLAGIDIAGYDLMFPDEGEPVFIEVNFHFGRKGIGGLKVHQAHVLRAIKTWHTRIMTDYETT